MSESKLITLYKPCGKKMEVNEKSLEYALSLGWTEESPEKENDGQEGEEKKEAPKKPAPSTTKK